MLFSAPHPSKACPLQQTHSLPPYLDLMLLCHSDDRLPHRAIYHEVCRLFVCVYTYVHTCSACAHKCILTCMHVHAENQRSMSDIFLSHSLPCFLRQGLSLSLKLMNSAGLAGQQPLGNPTVSVSPALDYRCLGWLIFHCSWFCFYMGSGELNVGPHAFMVSTSLPEPSLLSLVNLLKTQRCLI